MKMTKMKNDYKYIYPEGSNTFWVYSESADIDYLVSLPYSEVIDEAKEIAENAVAAWIEAEDETDPNWYKGFVEVVKEALEKANIPARIYVREDVEE